MDAIATIAEREILNQLEEKLAEPGLTSEQVAELREEYRSISMGIFLAELD